MSRRTQQATAELLRERRIFNDHNLAAAMKGVFVDSTTFRGTRNDIYEGAAVIDHSRGLLSVKITKFKHWDHKRQPDETWQAHRARLLRIAMESVGGEWEKSPFGGYHPKGTIAKVLGDE